MMTTEPASTSNPLGKFLIAAALILALVLGGLFVIKSQVSRPPTGNQAAQAAPGKEALPDLALDLYGGGKKKISELGAKVILINFWATWCTACVVEMPSIIALRSAYKSKGFEVVAVNLDDKPEAVLPKFLKRFGIDFPVYLDPDGKLGELFDVSAIPLTVIIDRDRKILFSHNGEADWNGADIRSRLEGWLAK